MICPCGDKKKFENCCELYILGVEQPKTALALMKSRYSAFVKKEFIYINDTMKGKAKEGFDLQQCQLDSQNDVWMGLEISAYEKGGESDEIGFVEFKATCIRAGQINQLHEKSEFSKINGRWYYVDGIIF